MTTAQPRPLQFSLKHIFGLTTLVGILLGLLPAAARTRIPLVPYYVLVGILQLACAVVVYQRWRSTGPLRTKPQEQPYELALLGAVVTFGTWVLAVILIVAPWMGVTREGSVRPMLPLAVAGFILHGPILALQIVGLFVMRSRLRYRALTAMFLLNIINVLMLLAVVVWSIGQVPLRLGPPG